MAPYKSTAPQSKTPSESSERYFSRDISWLKFNERVLDQVIRAENGLTEQLKFLMISALNLDEFFMVRVGSLYNCVEYAHKRKNHPSQYAKSLRQMLLAKVKKTFDQQHAYFLQQIVPASQAHHSLLVKDLTTLSQSEQEALATYFHKTLFSMLTPIGFNTHCEVPTVSNRGLVFGVITSDPAYQPIRHRYAFVPLPQNLPRFYLLHRGHETVFVPIEEIVRAHLPILFKNITLCSSMLLRIIRNGDISIEEGEGAATNFVEELQRKLKKRNQGRVVRLEVEADHDKELLALLKQTWDIEEENVFQVPTPSLVDLTGLRQLVQHHSDQGYLTVPVLTHPASRTGDLMELLKEQDLLLHHPYNSVDLVIDFIERAAEDPHVLSIKMTLYRLASPSAITAALCRAAALGKHVFVLIEIKARFDEEHNLQEASKLEQAGCSVMYGLSGVKTHAKMMMIVRSEADHVTRYVHLSSGNYNEETAKGYADVSLMTTDEAYAQDVAEFFNTLTGHSIPQSYTTLITTPLNMREQLATLIRQEAQNARQGLPCGIAIKVNALEDRATIEELYKASQAGVPIELIVRGICCLIPQKPGLSTNITVRSIVGTFLEHARIFYFHNQGDPKVYVGSSDLMVRSFDARIEALFIVKSPALRQQIINLLRYNLWDNVNAYLMEQDGTYVKVRPQGEAPFDIHQAFFDVTLEEAMQAQLFT